MPPEYFPESSPDTLRRLRERSSALTSIALRRLDEDLSWYSGLQAEERSWVGVVAQTGISSFISWYEHPREPLRVASEIFGRAPTELAYALSLREALQVVKVVVEVVENHVPDLASPGKERALREAVLIYSREIAFASADVYARAAEVRGAWDARLEAVIVDAIVRGDPEESIRSRVSALGWHSTGGTAVVVGDALPNMTEHEVAELRRRGRKIGQDCLVGLQDSKLILVIGIDTDAQRETENLLDNFGPGPVVIGPTVATLAEAATSARAALHGHSAVVAWPQAPRLIRADELLPERLLFGDEDARAHLVNHIYRPLAAHDGPLLETLTGFFGAGRSLEATARGLYVHPNTVRYRLKRIAEECGWDPADARESYVLQTALAAGRLADVDARSTTPSTQATPPSLL